MSASEDASRDPGAQGSPIAVAPLPERRADLWYALPGAVRNPELLGAYRGLLSREEKARHDRFWFDRDRHLFLVAWSLVRTMLSSYADVEPAAWRFALNPYGKPRIAGPAGAPPLRFNLSHTRGLVACIVAPELDVGVDVEDRRRDTAGIDIARRYFAAREVADFERLPIERQQVAFYEYWTLKEAYIKAVGVGISLGLGRFSLALDESGAPIGDPDRRPPAISFDVDLDDDPRAWQFDQFEPTPHHAMAVAIRRNDGADLPICLREVVPLVDDE
jgi:4'-phosphopantetheinyl transferase